MASPPSLSTQGVENLKIFNISMYILCTVFYTFPKELTMRICIKNQELLKLVIISFILVTFMCDLGVIL